MIGTPQYAALATVTRSNRILNHRRFQFIQHFQASVDLERLGNGSPSLSAKRVVPKARSSHPQILAPTVQVKDQLPAVTGAPGDTAARSSESSGCLHLLLLKSIPFSRRMAYACSNKA
eukprot:TRINITY_DN11481_c0_g1_i13.p3 TRINITY_DN11481_c0_g1~~TRINITY_DN11481_c0_g1_i13.p3  ORF type:complete len:118 (-),score=11.13 TRINITY_DN11481_c0_g1_i13:184-537(-)